MSDKGKGFIFNAEIASTVPLIKELETRGHRVWNYSREK